MPLEEFVLGGPPEDGIPSIDDPSFVPPTAADEWLNPESPVMVVRRGKAVKAYPLAILTYHEIVNDSVSDIPVAVTHCPLCNTAFVIDRRVEGRILDFGTTGRLRHSDLVMYDRWTESWWQRATGEAIVGRLTGATLECVPADTLSWARARELYPDLEVLSKETGFARRYGTNPYAGCDTLEAAGNGFRDRETDSTWSLVGVAVAGPLEGSRLETLRHGNPFRFARAAFRPGTRVWRPHDPRTRS